MAALAKKAGHQVTLLSSVTHFKSPKGVKVIPFQSTLDLGKKLIQEFKKTDILFMAAAVSDFIPHKFSKHKIKRRDKEFCVKLKPAPDLLKKLSFLKRKQKCVGFCLETETLEESARRKLRSKKLDMIVGNFLGAGHNPFGTGKTSVLILNKKDERVWIEGKKKREIARFLIKEVCKS